MVDVEEDSSFGGQSYFWKRNLLSESLLYAKVSFLLLYKKWQELSRQWDLSFAEGFLALLPLCHASKYCKDLNKHFN